MDRRPHGFYPPPQPPGPGHVRPPGYFQRPPPPANRGRYQHRGPQGGKGFSYFCDDVDNMRYFQAGDACSLVHRMKCLWVCFVARFRLIFGNLLSLRDAAVNGNSVQALYLMTSIFLFQVLNHIVYTRRLLPMYYS